MYITLPHRCMVKIIVDSAGIITQFRQLGGLFCAPPSIAIVSHWCFGVGVHRVACAEFPYCHRHVHHQGKCSSSVHYAPRQVFILSPLRTKASVQFILSPLRRANREQPVMYSRITYTCKSLRNLEITDWNLKTIHCPAPR